MAQDPSATSPADFWDERYREPGFSFGEQPNTWLATHKALFKVGMRALVPGDGEGRNGVFLAEQGLNVTTVDASAVGVHKAQILAAERGVTLDAHAADLTTWSWPVAEFDLVASIYLHWPVALRTTMHARMVAALKPGGVMILEGYSLRQLVYRAAGSIGGPRDPAMLFEPREIVKDFAALKITHIEETSIRLDEGKRHRGASSVVRLTGTRAKHR